VKGRTVTIKLFAADLDLMHYALNLAIAWESELQSSVTSLIDDTIIDGGHETYRQAALAIQRMRRLQRKLASHR